MVTTNEKISLSRAKGVRPNVTRGARDIWPDPFGTLTTIAAACRERGPGTYDTAQEKVERHSEIYFKEHNL